MQKLKVQFINHPFVFTEEGIRLEVKDFETQPRVGAIVQFSDSTKKYKTVGNGTDNADCVGGQCPIK